MSCVTTNHHESDSSVSSYPWCHGVVGDSTTNEMRMQQWFKDEVQHLVDERMARDYEQRLEETIASIKRDYDQRMEENIANIRREYEEKIATIRREYEDNIVNIRREYEEKIATIRRDYDNASGCGYISKWLEYESLFPTSKVVCPHHLLFQCTYAHTLHRRFIACSSKHNDIFPVNIIDASFPLFC